MNIRHRILRKIPFAPLASIGNAMMMIRGDQRRFAVDAAGRWINRQPEATFVSPDVFTAFYTQVDTAVTGYWCPFDRPQPGDTIVDVGAGIGEDAVVFSKMVGPEGRVIAIEAHPETFACLQETIDRSRLGNVLAVHCAIADRQGVLTISDDSHHLANSTLGGLSGVDVPAKTLDCLLGEMGVEAVDLLKMNIEGAERPAMVGMTGSAQRIRSVAISCHDFIADRGGIDDYRTRDFVRSALQSMGFTLRERDDAEHPWLRDTVYGKRA